MREAESRLASSELGRKATLAGMPVFLIVGREGSAKTSAIVQSGLDPELLAGNVFQESMVAPTRAANFWYARRAALVEAGGKLLADAGSFGRLLRRLRPGTLAPLFGRAAQAPRAAVVCFSCDEFLQPGATEALSVASRTAARRSRRSRQVLRHAPAGVCGLHEDGPDSVLRRLRPQSQQ